MTNTQALTKFANTIGVELDHPAHIAALIDRRAHAITVRANKAQPLADTLADLDPPKWAKAIRDRAIADAEAASREALFRTLPTVLDKRLERATRDHLDHYLTQLHTQLTRAESELVDAAQHLTPLQLDPATAVANHVGDHLSRFDTALTVLTAYGELLQRQVPATHDRQPTTALGGYASPPDTPTEERTVVDAFLMQRTITAPDVMARINAARQVQQSLTSTLRRRHTIHAIANDATYSIRAARTVAEFIEQSTAWRALDHVEIVNRHSEDRFALPTMTAL